MTSVASVDSTTAASNQGSAALDAQAELAAAGLPPTNLARAATTNTVNASLVSSQWGVDPTTVAGVYGGVGANGGLFASDNLLPLLTNLTRTNAEQALSLLGIKTPTPGSSTAGSAPTVSATATSNAQSQSALAQAYGGTASGTVDPLWGKSA